MHTCHECSSKALICALVSTECGNAHPMQMLPGICKWRSNVWAALHRVRCGLVWCCTHAGGRLSEPWPCNMTHWRCIPCSSGSLDSRQRWQGYTHSWRWSARSTSGTTITTTAASSRLMGITLCRTSCMLRYGGCHNHLRWWCDGLRDAALNYRSAHRSWSSLYVYSCAHVAYVAITRSACTCSSGHVWCSHRLTPWIHVIVIVIILIIVSPAWLLERGNKPARQGGRWLSAVTVRLCMCRVIKSKTRTTIMRLLRTFTFMLQILK